MIKYYYRSVKDQAVVKLTRPKPGCWIKVSNFNLKDLDTLVKLGFSRPILEDALDPYEVPRFEYENKINYLFSRYPLTDSATTATSATAVILIAISDNYILTVTNGSPQFIKRFLESASVVTTQRVKFLLMILDRVLSDYDHSLKKIRKTLGRHLSTTGQVSEEDLINLVKIEAVLADYVSHSIPAQEAFSTMLIRKKTLTLHQDDAEMLEDFMQDTAQIIASAKNSAKTATNIRALHEVILSQRLNKIMKTLTALTIVLTIPTIMSGIFGMNTWLPLTHGPIQFLMVLALTLLLSLMATFWLVKNRWF